MNKKTILALASIVVVIITFVLLPRRSKTNTSYEPPRTASRYVPAPLPTSIDTSSQLITVNSQPPGVILLIESVNPQEPIYIAVERFGGLIGQSEVILEKTQDLGVDLDKETNDGDMVIVKAMNKKGEELFSKEILITITTIAPGAILPKDLK